MACKGGGKKKGKGGGKGKFESRWKLLILILYGKDNNYFE